MAVDETADLEGKEMEEGGLKLRKGREGWFCSSARAGWMREGAGSDCRQGSGLGFGSGYDAGCLRFCRPRLEDAICDVAKEAEKVRSR